jgi:UDP-perosamine 4-acetyltransferase
MVKTLALIGSGGHAKSILSAASLENYSEVYSVTWGLEKFCSELPIKTIHVSSLAELPIINSTDYLVAVGEMGLRIKIVNELLDISPGIVFANAISSNSVIAKSAKLGRGIFIGAGVYVGPDSRIGNHVILNTGVILEHDCSVSDFSIISPGVVIGGQVEIDTKTFIGMGSTLRNGIRVGKNALIGAGSLVLNDIEPESLNYGVPSKKIKNLES